MFNLVQEMESFAGQLRDADTFTGTAADWLQVKVSYVSTRHEHLSATADFAAALEVEAGSDVLHRSGWLQTESQQVVADVYATVAPSRLTAQAKSALDARTAPLGLILAEMGAKRHTRRISLTEATGQFGRQVMRVDATITMTEQPVAVVSEIVYHRLFMLRAS